MSIKSDNKNMVDLLMEVSSEWVNNKIRSFRNNGSDYNNRRINKVQKYADNKSDEEGGSYNVLSPSNRPYTLYLRAVFTQQEPRTWTVPVEMVEMVDQTSGESYKGVTKKLYLIQNDNQKWAIQLRDVGENGYSPFKFAERKDATKFYQTVIYQIPHLKDLIKPSSFDIY